MTLKKIIYLVVGCLALGLGAVGVFLPILPTVPFLLVAAFCFARSSQKLHNWFIGTKLYKKNLESYVSGKGMTRGAKIRIMTTVTIIMGVGFALMLRKGIYVPCIILGCVWVCHIIFFVFGVKEYKGEEKPAEKAEGEIPPPAEKENEND